MRKIRLLFKVGTIVRIDTFNTSELGRELHGKSGIIRQAEPGLCLLELNEPQPEWCKRLGGFYGVTVPTRCLEAI